MQGMLMGMGQDEIEAASFNTNLSVCSLGKLFCMERIFHGKKYYSMFIHIANNMFSCTYVVHVAIRIVMTTLPSLHALLMCLVRHFSHCLTNPIPPKEGGEEGGWRGRRVERKEGGEEGGWRGRRVERREGWRGGWRGERDGEEGGWRGGRDGEEGGWRGGRDGEEGGWRGGRDGEEGGWRGGRDGEEGGWRGGRGEGHSISNQHTSIFMYCINVSILIVHQLLGVKKLATYVNILAQ